MTAPPRTVSTSIARPAGWVRVGLSVAAVAWGANQFAPLLLVYRSALGISSATADATFALYAVGLIPGLLIGGPVSDRRGRRPVLGAALVASLLAGALLAFAGDHGTGLLFAGRFVAGVASGAAFSSGAAWIRELSGASGARRATVAMTAGFASGSLVAGLLAQWAPDPTVLPYLPQLALAAVCLPTLLGGGAAAASPPTSSASPASSPAPVAPAASRTAVSADGAWRHPRFWRVVVPLAPWVFGSGAVALAFLPGVVADRLGSNAFVFAAGTITLGAVTGLIAAPLARRLSPVVLLAAAMATVIVGLVVAALATIAVSPWLVVVASILLGSAYGLCQVAGLGEVQRIAPAGRLAAMTAVYQCLTYLGFGVPFLLAAAAPLIAPGHALLVLAGLAAVTLTAVLDGARR